MRRGNQEDRKRRRRRKKELLGSDPLTPAELISFSGKLLSRLGPLFAATLRDPNEDRRQACYSSSVLALAR